MAGSLNKVTLIGNLGNDPEVRSLNNGNKVVNLSIATSDHWRDKNTGERKEKTEWHRVVIFSEGLAKVAEQYLRKGSKVYLEGALQTRKWQDQSGADRYSTEIVLQGFGSQLIMLDGRRDDEDDRSGDQGRQQPSGGGFGGRPGSDRPGQDRRPSSAPAFESGPMDDDIPF